MRHPLLHLILLALPACSTREEGEACLLVPDDTPSCPAPDEVDLDELIPPWDCDNDVVGMLQETTPEVEAAVFQDGSTGCCYEVVMVDHSPNSECVVGRPYVQDGVSLGAAAPDLAGAARAWAAVARAEHASIAAFARLQLQLMAHGAPLALLDGVARATADEVRHARLALDRATRLAGAPVTLGPFPFPAPVAVDLPLARLAADAAREGCVGETLSALATRRAAQRAVDPALRAELAAIADDEERHAVLSWQIVAWALRVGGAEVRQAVVAALRAPVRFGGVVEDDTLGAQGILGPAAMRGVAIEGLREVVAPAATALLAA